MNPTFEKYPRETNLAKKGTRFATGTDSFKK